jgi:hypothetical protein
MCLSDHVAELVERTRNKLQISPQVAFEIAGVHFVVRSDSAWALSQVKLLLSLHLEHQIGAPAEVFEIFITHDGPTDVFSTLTSRTSSWSGKLADRTPARVSHLGSGCTEFCLEDNVAVWSNHPAGFAVCYIREEQIDAKRRRPQPGGYINPLLQLILSGYSKFVIHGAAVALDDQGALLLGNSGAGKSTTSLTLAQAGLGFMGDDLIILEAGDQGPLIHAFLMKPKIRKTETDRKELLDPDRDLNISCQRLADLASVALLTQSPAQQNRFSRLDAGTTCENLLHQGCNINFLCQPANWFHLATEIAKTVKSWHWELGGIETIGPEHIRTLLGADHDFS